MEIIEHIKPSGNPFAYAYSKSTLKFYLKELF